MKAKRLMALLLCLLTVIGLMPGVASAAASTVTIESQTNSAFDYLQYYADGTWKDLNTPRHWIESTGEIVYCVEHAATNPHGQTYTATSPSNVFSSSTLSGLNSILMYGYPNNTPSGFTADEARQATANAIRFWLSEQGEAESYSFTNRSANPTYIRAKSGYEHVLEYADELLAKARARQSLPHAIGFSPSTVQLTASGSGFSGQTSVQLTNINSGYTLNTNGLPSGASVTGYTGSRSETLTITVPASAAGQSFSISAQGSDTRSVDNITAYVPSSGGLQKIFLCATTAQVVATASFNVGVPAFGKVQLVKTGTNGAALAGVKFGVYSDSSCANKLTELTTGADGTITSENLSVGTVYIKELSTVSPYVITAEVKSAAITTNNTAKVTFTNTAATGKIRVQKTGDVLTSSQSTETEYGTVSVPAYAAQGLAGVVYEVKNAAGTVVATLTTNASGVAETGALPFATYTVQEKSAPSAYIVDDTVHTVTIAYKDQNTPVVTVTINADNDLQTGKVKIRKITEMFNYDKIDFYNALAEGYVFGLYTAQTIGDVPADVLVEVLTTDDQGIAETSVQLPYGDYYLKELAVPVETVEMLTDRLPLTIDSALNVQHYDSPIYNTMFKARIGVYKLDAANKERVLAGAVFEVRDTAGKLFDTITTNSDGYAETIDLPVGEYKVKEVVPPAGFILSDEVKTITLTSEDKGTAVFELTNKANVARIRKLDSKTEQPLANAAVKVTDAGGKVFYEGKTGSDGYIHMKELPAGKYTWQETAAPDTYSIDTGTYSITIDNYGKVTGDVEFANEPITLEITKMNTYTNAPFAGITFTLHDSEGKAIKTKLAEGGYRIPVDDGTETFVTDANGKAVFKYLKAGKYKLVETVPVGYIADGMTEIELTDKHSETAPCKVTVNNCPTGIKVLKIDASSEKPISGAGFRFKVKDGLGFETLAFTKQDDGKYIYDAKGTVMDLMVDNNGEVYVHGLPLGDVWIEESVVPTGYFPVSARKIEVTSEMSAVKPLEIKIPNNKSVKLGMDTDWWELPAMILGAILLLGGGAFLVIKRRKKLRGSEE
ncbi:MAG: SpaA isopeptide-forming pilin-related protein [Eubacteriales bacterium]|nr:SpaA isopeptide-forming pilin-related protein [Eubacteriales bacterium]